MDTVTIWEGLNTFNIYKYKYIFTQLPFSMQCFCNIILVIFFCLVCFVQEVEEFVEGSGEHGIVVFTLGSLIASMPKEKAEVFFKAFSVIPQRVRNGLKRNNAGIHFREVLSSKAKCKKGLESIQSSASRASDVVRDLSPFSDLQPSLG